MNHTWLCPNCWQRRPIADHCPSCGPNPAIGLYRHPPVDPITGNVSAGDDSILMGQMRHCDVPERFRNPSCIAVMDDHGWLDSGGDGTAVCPPSGGNRFADCTSRDEVIRQAIGAGSVCWVYVGSDGYFDSDEAVRISDEAIERIQQFDPFVEFQIQWASPDPVYVELLTRHGHRIAGYVRPDR